VEDTAGRVATGAAFSEDVAAIEGSEDQATSFDGEAADAIAEELAEAERVGADETKLRLAGIEFLSAVDDTEPNNVAPEKRSPSISFAPEDETGYAVGNWHPASVSRYSVTNPYQEHNSKLTNAATNLIGATMAFTGKYKHSGDPKLAYLDVNRASGKEDKMTTATKNLCSIDPSKPGSNEWGIEDWIKHLPNPEQLRVVAHPYGDVSTVMWNKEKQQVVEYKNTPELRALVGGANDGRGIGDREAFQKTITAQFVDPNMLQDNKVRITSLGTGTGEPTMDSGLALMQPHGGKVEVTGYDVSEDALKTASYMADKKRQGLDDPSALEFRAMPPVNLLRKKDLAKAVAGQEGDAPNVVEAIGFAEYAPSKHATDPVEKAQHAKMKGLETKLADRARAEGKSEEEIAENQILSAEDFYQTVYENMQEGAVFITGNMGTQSKQAPFVVDGLGWKGIIQRPLTGEESEAGEKENGYLDVLKNAGIPGEAIHIYTPDEAHSAGIYNLVAIQKIRKPKHEMPEAA
jgi:hypothetical protein